MRQAYRRKPTRRIRIAVTTIFHAFAVVIVEALLGLWVLQLLGGTSELGWSAVVFVAAMVFGLLAAGMQVLTGLSSLRPPADRPVRTAMGNAVQFVQGPRTSGWEALSNSLWIAHGSLLVVAGFGGLPPAGAPEAGWLPIFGALICAGGVYGLWKLHGRAAAPRRLMIDGSGLHASWGDRRFVPWHSVQLVHVTRTSNSGSFAERDRIELYGRYRPSQGKRLHRIGWGKWSHSFWFDRPLLRIAPRDELGVSPADVLDALDRFRPPSVTIHDPRRIVDPEA